MASATAAANAKILQEWQEELKDIDVASLPPDVQEMAALMRRRVDGCGRQDASDGMFFI